MKEQSIKCGGGVSGEQPLNTRNSDERMIENPDYTSGTGTGSAGKIHDEAKSKQDTRRNKKGIHLPSMWKGRT